jgi:hypothetical protein
MQRAIDSLRSQFREERLGLEWCLEDEYVETVSEEEP